MNYKHSHRLSNFVSNNKVFSMNEKKKKKKKQKKEKK